MLRGLSLPSKSVVRQTDCAPHDPIGLTGPCLISFYYNHVLQNFLNIYANSEDPNQMLCSAASDRGLHCLPVSLLWEASLK